MLREEVGSSLARIQSIMERMNPKFPMPYIAALLDNSGKILIKQINTKQTMWFKHHVSVASHHKALVETLAAETNGKVAPLKDQYLCTWAAGPAYNLLLNVHQHLKVKHIQADLVMQFLLDVYMGNLVDKDKAAELVLACNIANNALKVVEARVERPEAEIVFVGEGRTKSTRSR